MLENASISEEFLADALPSLLFNSYQSVGQLEPVINYFASG
jgi:hypothetical protein